MTIGLLSEGDNVGEWMKVVFERAPSTKLCLCSGEFLNYLNRTFDPDTRRNKRPGNSHQRRKRIRYLDRMWSRIGGAPLSTSSIPSWWGGDVISTNQQ